MSKAIQGGLIAVVLVGSVALAADEFKLGDARAAKEKYESAVREANKRRDEALKQLKAMYVKELRDAAKAALDKNDVAEAQRILTAIETLAVREGQPRTSALSRKDKRKLEERVQMLEKRMVRLVPCCLVEQVGTVGVTIPAGEITAKATVKFDRPQPEQAIVLTGETGPGGRFLVTKSEAITNTKFDIVVLNAGIRTHDVPYRTRVGYVVLRGQGKKPAEER